MERSRALVRQENKKEEPYDKPAVQSGGLSYPGIHLG